MKKILKSAHPLEVIPGIGSSLARDLVLLGYHQVEDLKNQNPQDMYERLEHITKSHQDPCVLYTFRCAVYFASNIKHEPKLLKWWNWKNKEL